MTTNATAVEHALVAMILNPRVLSLDPTATASAATVTFARGTKATAKLQIVDWRDGVVVVGRMTGKFRSNEVEERVREKDVVNA
jgi:hypothetical protein